MSTAPTPRTAAELAAALKAQAPSGAFVTVEAGALPAGVEAGHAYAYSGHGRMGTAWANADGTFTAKARGGGLPHAWATTHAASLRWTHATLPCGCGA
jgi:hypothetical protein